jgi:hypothetical protein
MEKQWRCPCLNDVGISLPENPSPRRGNSVTTNDART